MEEKWCLTKFCVKDDVCKNSMRKMVCNKAVSEKCCGKIACERLCVCVTKWYVKDGG